MRQAARLLADPTQPRQQHRRLASLDRLVNAALSLRLQLQLLLLPLLLLLLLLLLLRVAAEERREPGRQLWALSNQLPRRAWRTSPWHQHP